MANIRELNAHEKEVFSNAIYLATGTFEPMRPVMALLRVYHHDELATPTGTDLKWRIFLSDDFFSDTYTTEARAYMLVHETFHNLYRHAERASSVEYAHDVVSVNGAPMPLFILAGDLEVNGFIQRRRNDKAVRESQIKYAIDPSQALLPQHFGLNEDGTMENYLEWLRNLAEEQEQDGQGGAGGSGESQDGSQEGAGQGSSDGTNGQQDDQQGDSQSGSGDGQGNPTQGTAPDLNTQTGQGQGCSYVDPAEGDSRGLEAPSNVTVQKGVNDFKALAQDEAQRQGMGNSSMNELLGTLNAVEGRTIHDYGKILRNAKTNHLMSKKRGQHFTNYRRIKRKDTYGNGILQPTRNKPSATYFVIIDGSGSMLNEYDMSNVARETQGFFELIQRQGGIVHVATGDTELGYLNKDVKDIADVMLSGGGGTDMVPLIRDAIEVYDADNIILISDMEVPVQGFDEIITENFKRQFLLISTDTMSSYPEALINLGKMCRNLQLISARGI